MAVLRILIFSMLLLLTSAAGGAPSGYLPEVSFNFGKVRQGEIVEHGFALRNTSSLPMKLQIVGLSHPGMKVKAPQVVLPGAEALISVNWDTRSVRGDIAATVLLRLNEVESTSLTLKARVVPPIDILPLPAVFISGFRHEKAVRTLEMVNNEEAPLNITHIAASEPSEAASIFSANFRATEPGRRYEIDVELKANAPAGKSQQALEIFTDHPDFPVIEVPVNVFVKDEVYVNPEAVDFGEITIKNPIQETFFLKKHFGAIEILSVESDLPCLKIQHNQDATGSSHEFLVDFQGGDVRDGPFSGHIYIRTDDAAFSEITVPVKGEVHK
jgi:hypothetical protein